MNTEARLLLRIRQLERMVVDLANSSAAYETGLDHVISVANAFAFELGRLQGWNNPSPVDFMVSQWDAARDGVAK